MDKTATQQIASELGAKSASLRYEDGGKVQVVTLDDVEYRVPGTLHLWDIIPAVKELMK